MKIDYQLPPELLKSLERYKHNYIATGGFLRACLANDFIGAMNRVDLENRKHLFAIAQYMQGELPMQAYGGYATVDAWIKGKK